MDGTRVSIARAFRGSLQWPYSRGTLPDTRPAVFEVGLKLAYWRAQDAKCLADTVSSTYLRNSRLKYTIDGVKLSLSLSRGGFLVN